MPTLKTTIEVDDEAIERHLLELVQKKLHGPEFSVGDVVTLTDEAANPTDPGDDPLPPGFGLFGEAEDMPATLRDVLAAGTIGCVESIGRTEAGEGAYGVVLVGTDGETYKVDLPARAMQHRDAVVL